MISEPLDKGIAEDIESGKVSIRMPPRTLATYFEKEHGYDKLASRSVWTFGPDEQGPNILMDDTLPSDVNIFSFDSNYLFKLINTVRLSRLIRSCYSVSRSRSSRDSNGLVEKDHYVMNVRQIFPHNFISC